MVDPPLFTRTEVLGLHVLFHVHRLALHLHLHVHVHFVAVGHEGDLVVGLHRALALALHGVARGVPRHVHVLHFAVLGHLAVAAAASHASLLDVFSCHAVLVGHGLVLHAGRHAGHLAHVHVHLVLVLAFLHLALELVEGTSDGDGGSEAGEGQQAHFHWSWVSLE